jgi:hypothetical protein
MSPHLTASPNPIRTADPPLVHLADGQVAQPPGHCYACGFTTCTRVGSDHTPRPLTLDQWANFTAADIEWQTLRDLGVSSWSESQAAMIRALAGHLLEDADYADRYR